MDERAQTSGEFLLLIGGAILFVLIVVAVLRSGVFTEATGETQFRITNYTAFLANITNNTVNGT